MPRYFSRKAKYSSFTRKLNRWNFVRVSSGPEIGSYYHEFFLRDKPHLAAQMFCKNARTMLAMASSNENGQAKAPAASVAEVPAVPQINPDGQMATSVGPPATIGGITAGLGAAGLGPSMSEDVMMPQRQTDGNLPNPLLAALKGAPTSNPVAAAQNGMENASVSDLKGALLNSVPINTLQFLERQLQVLQQQEQANRLIMEQAMALSIQQRHRPSSHSPVSINQHARLLQMRQLMEARQRQQKGRVPTNSRASAA